MPTNMNHAEDVKAKPTAIGGLLGIAVALLKFLITRALKNRERAAIKLQNWKNDYVEKRNARIAAVSMLKSVDELSEKARNKSRGNPACRRK